MTFNDPGPQEPKHPWKDEKAEKFMEWVMAFFLFGLSIIALIWIGKALLT